MAERPEWRLADEPLFSVGDPAPSPAYELYQITSARSFPDGRVVVTMGTEEVRIFGPDGIHLLGAGGTLEQILRNMMPGTSVTQDYRFSLS